MSSVLSVVKLFSDDTPISTPTFLSSSAGNNADREGEQGASGKQADTAQAGSHGGPLRPGRGLARGLALLASALRLTVAESVKISVTL